MADIHSRIASIGPKNSELLATLSRTDWAEASLKQQILYINDLEQEKASTSKKIKDLEYKTKLEKWQYLKYKESNITRLAYKMSGKKDKFQSKTEKEEREYYEAIEAERAAKDRVETISKALEDAKKVHDDYKLAVDEHTHAQYELDALYNSLFNGPTPEYPAEDQAEWTFTQVRESFNAAEQQYRAVDQSLSLLREAAKHMANARQKMGDARDASRADMMGGGVLTDMAERNALQAAQSAVGQTETLMAQAIRINPTGVRSLGPMTVAQGNMTSDILFDNIFSDMDFHDKIKRSQAQIEQAAAKLPEQVRSLEQSHGPLKAALDRKQEELAQARQALQQHRASIIAQTTAAQPPAYNYAGEV